MLLQVACNQLITRGDLLYLQGLEKWNNFPSVFGWGNCRDRWARMTGWRGAVNQRWLTFGRVDVFCRRLMAGICKERAVLVGWCFYFLTDISCEK